MMEKKGTKQAEVIAKDDKHSCLCRLWNRRGFAFAVHL